MKEKEFFQNISKENILKAIQEIDENGIEKGAHSSTYDVVYNDKRYPPKLVVSLANKYANGTLLPRDTFSGGEDTPAFQLLERLGFEIVKKRDPIASLIENYKRHIETTQLKDERYKWDLINEFKGRPNTEASDFYEELKSIKYQNLIYPMAIVVINRLAKERPEEVRVLFKYLFNEEISLIDRIKNFNSDSLKLYRSLDAGGLQHHQDERSMATYLTFFNPAKYTFYKASFYKKYCELLGIKAARKNEKYVHYLQLLNELIEKHIKPDKDLLDKVNKYIPENVGTTYYSLVAQDILYQMLEKKGDISYWIFQGNPNVFDFETAIKQDLITDWTVSAHKDKIKIGDKVILWITGKKSGCYALAEVTSEPHERTSSPDDHLWKEDDKSEFKADIKITHNLSNSPILKENIESLEALKNLKVGNQGTNFSATKEEYDALLNIFLNNKTPQYWLYAPGESAEKWEEFYNDGIMALGWDDIGDLNQYNNRKEIRDALISAYGGEGSKKNDVSANDDFINKVNIGDVIITKKGRGELLGYGVVTSDYFHDNQRTEYKSCRKVDWKIKGNWKVDFNLVLKTLTDITKYDSEHPDYDKYSNRLLGIIKGDQPKLGTMKQAVNTIFYGPPGTGKTYTLKEQYFDRYTTSETSLSAEKHFENVIQKVSWWEVIAVALLELKKAKVSGILEHPWVQKKEALSNNKNIRATLWGTLQAHTIEGCAFVNVKRKMAPLIFNKTEDSFWEILEEEVHEVVPELFDLINSVNDFQPNPDTQIERYEFVTFHQSFSYEDFIEGIKPIMPEDGEEANDLGYKIEDGVFKKLCIRAGNDPENRYAIFIDEINRGNISQIFGELITLIEKDKRKGEEHQLSALLPYSKKPFMVPANLDIYGTMNTADRSVEALDTALRRRFSFVEMMPDHELLNGKTIEGISLKKVLKTINERVELLVDRDHTIGHSYFINVETKEQLVEAFNDKIIPLLQEYFYGDFGKIGLVLGSGFVKVKDNKNTEFASFDYDEQDDFKTATYTLCKATEESILDSIGSLLKTNSDNTSA